MPITEAQESRLSDPADWRLAEDEALLWADGLTGPSQYLGLFGWPQLTLWIETDPPDADLHATLALFDTEGRHLKFSDNLLRLRYRAGTHQDLPYTPGVTMRAVLGGFTFVSRRVRAGGRLRLPFPLEDPHG